MGPSDVFRSEMQAAMWNRPVGPGLVEKVTAVLKVKGRETVQRS